MSSILDRIITDTRQLLARQKASTSVSALEDMEGFARTPLSLHRALSDHVTTHGFAIIAEAKKASPSKGIIRESFDIVEIVRAYSENGAAALSILTEPVHFMGDPTFLQMARRETHLPLLRKDFIVDPYQMAQARAWGADAVLLIATVLDRQQAAELMDAAASFGLSVLMELYDVRELDRLDVDRLDVVGVNSRDLHTFEVDLDRAIRALDHLPEHVVRVAESGIAGPEDIAYVRERGVHAALIGETFMRQADVGAALANCMET